MKKYSGNLTLKSKGEKEENLRNKKSKFIK